MGNSRQDGALAATCIFPVLAALFVSARTVSRHIGQNHGWDDWLIYLSLLLLLGQTITIYEYILASHTGYHSSEVPKQTVEQQVNTLKWSFAVQMFYHPTMGAIRASIVMFLFRIRDKRWHIRWALHIVFWINIGYLVSTTLVNIFQCDPVRYAYLRPKMNHVDADGNIIAGGKCINSLQFIMTSCALSIFMDLVIMPIPTAMVWNLQMKRKTKAAVVAVMSMGWIATIASVSRLIVYYYRFSPSTDRTHDIGVITSVTEPSIAIIAACAPALGKLMRHCLPQYFPEDATYPAYTYNATYERADPMQSDIIFQEIDKEMGMGRIPEHEEEDMSYGMINIRRKESMEATRTKRSMSTRTGMSESTNQPFVVNPTEPLDVLNQRQ